MNLNWIYSPETPNLGQILRFLEPCDLEIWRMTLKNNRAPLLSNIKLCASFHHHMWIQTGVTVRKPLSWFWPWPLTSDLTFWMDVCCAVNVPLPLTDTIQLPVNGPCKSRYLAKNVICSKVLSLNIQLYYCIVVFPRLYPNTTYMRNTDYTDYTDNRVVFIIWKDNVNAICATTISSNRQLRYCIAVFPRLYPPNTYLPNTDYIDCTDYRVVLNHRHR